MNLRRWPPVAGERRTESGQGLKPLPKRAVPVTRLAHLPDAAAVVQLQTSAGNRAVSTVLQREPKTPPKKKSVAPKSPAKSPPKAANVATGPHQQLYIVRDKGLGLGGGVLVQDLKDLKSKVMTTTIKTDWTLVLSIHGSEDRLGAQAPPNWEKNAVFYKEADISTLFNDDQAFVTWRDQFGPTHLALVSCQVNAMMEGVLISNLTRLPAGKRRQGRQGLGEGCKPIPEATKLDDAPATRSGYDKLLAAKRESIIEQLKELNMKWGYYGAPPVPEDQLLAYYYNEDPKGEWVVVKVWVGTGHDLADLKPTGIPFWNRATGPDAEQFRRQCDQGVGKLKRPRKVTVPSVPDD